MLLPSRDVVVLLTVGALKMTEELECGGFTNCLGLSLVCLLRLII